MEKDYTISEGYSLPSRGEIYSTPVEPRVELKSMTTLQEMRRQTATNTPYKLLADIIEECLVTKPKVHVYDMCIGDYEYLLHKLRVVSHGANYKMGVMCPKCGHTETVTINLDELEVQNFDLDEYLSLKRVTLSNGKEVVLKMQTPRILDEIELKKEDFKKHNKECNFDPTLLVTLQLMIDTYDGQKYDMNSLEDIILRLPISDSYALIDRIDKMNRTIGLDTSFSYKCGNSKCRFEVLTFFRFGPEFFRPENN